jgi:two-component system, chemotaxis family, chemotaxis protein CheY
MLRKCGSANVDQVHDGPTALQKLREKSYLFVVSDREMPGMNGLELAREIRADPKIRNAPLVIMSASSEPQHAEAAIAAGAKFFMTKPFNLTTLKVVIRQSLQSGGSGADQIRCRSHHHPGGDCRALSERHRQHVRSRRCRASNNRADRDVSGGLSRSGARRLTSRRRNAGGNPGVRPECARPHRSVRAERSRGPRLSRCNSCRTMHSRASCAACR